MGRHVTDTQIETLNGEFEHSIPQVLKFVGKAFSLVFIDPTGSTGFGLKQITPILQHRPGEVLVNFMFDYINRFLDDPRPDIAASFAELFGGPGWETAVRSAVRREDAIVDLYKERMRAAGGFAHVTSTRILKPTHDRSYFYLVYGTRHFKGLVEFREVERKAVDEQERVRLAAKQENREARTGQTELFTPDDVAGIPTSFAVERAPAQRAPPSIACQRSSLDRFATGALSRVLKEEAATMPKRVRLAPRSRLPNGNPPLGHFRFPRKSFTFFYFTDQASS